MSQYIPFRASFDQAKSFEKYSNIILLISTLILIINFLINSYYPKINEFASFLNNINCFFIIAYSILSFLKNFTFFDASSFRRYDFVDNSFQTKFGEKKSKEYYTNDTVEEGIYKMAVNSFENCLFSYNISKKMTFTLWVKNIIFAIVIIGFAIFGFNNILILLIQLTLPLFLLHDAIKLQVFVYRIKRTLENFRRLFNDLSNTSNIQQKEPEIILNVLDYETAIVSGAVLLDSKIYNQLNPELSTDWNRIKKEYSIN